MGMNRKIRRFQERIGHSWWWRRYADLVDRNNGDGTYKPFDFDAANLLVGARTSDRTIRTKIPGAEKPEMVRRPEGMTRQAQRRLYRQSCKLAGVPWRTERLFKTPRRERGRNWKDLSPEETAKLEAQWAEYMENSLQIK